tara:strand:+ start:45 stop:1235 length:1191 start_codon:yes stop_codon:yes gene_type:complete
MITFGKFLNLNEAVGKINPTKFEMDIVNEINSRNKKNFKAEGGGNASEASDELADLVVNHLTKEYLVPKSAEKGSGGGGVENLTQIYIDNNVKSGEPKTDILVNKVSCSVKKAEGAQFASAQAGEIVAVITAAFNNKKFASTKGKLVSNIKDIVKESLDKKNFYDLRSEFGEGNAFDRVFGKVMGLDPKKPTADEIKSLSSVLDKSGMGKKVSQSIYTFMNTDEAKLALITEFITGKGRFVNKKHIPEYILAWSAKTGKTYYEDIIKYIKQTYKSGGFKYRVSDRGSERGGAFRLEPKHMTEAVNLTSSEKIVAQELVETFDQELELLDEGVLSKVKGIAIKGKDILIKGWKMLKSAIKSIFKFFAMLFAKGIGFVSKIFKIEVLMGGGKQTFPGL